MWFSGAVVPKIKITNAYAGFQFDALQELQGKYAKIRLFPDKKQGTKRARELSLKTSQYPDILRYPATQAPA